MQYLEAPVDEKNKIPDKFIHLFYIGILNSKKTLYIRRKILFFLQEFPYAYQDYLFEIINITIFNYSQNKDVEDWALEDTDGSEDLHMDESLFLINNLKIDTTIQRIWSSFIDAYNLTVILIKNKENELSNDDFLEI